MRNANVFYSVMYADSKVLKEHQRDKLFKDINSSEEFIGWKVEVLSPNCISNSMLQR